MPSLLDLLENGDEAPEPEATPPEQPAPVPPATTTSERRWPVVGHRRLAALVLAGVVLAAGSLVAVQRIGDGGDQAQVKVTTDDRVLSDPLTDPAPTFATVEPVPTTGTTAEPSPAADPVPPADSPATTTAKAATAATATTPAAESTATGGRTPSSGVAPSSTNPPPGAAKPPNTIGRVCRNSTDPACGPFRWDPAPAPNQPLEASLRHPETVAAGEVVEFEMVWSDRDADLSYDHLALDGRSVPAPCARVDRYGPWTPPAVRSASGKKTYRRRFDAAGTYDVVVDLRTGDCTSPYSNDLQIRTTIEVTEAPAPD